ncbi:tRNA (mnm(5)s(2)U34)-methyltransferase [Streptococcus uberis]|uniref:Methyltransferase domain-containing protein n=1 Tax=Streptococcus uberis TaxID=1349 RepID=A0A6L6GCB2_STRUB|nr:class I SAM-dependent methyltransferase [Streptococcus uberis]MTB35998.1 methyltransferase domain-containing protein [Streptococcus uberis]MTB37798.1 methyltransferase domain-containing protein [Streptococcus uberis]MTB54566.1 methyltransferase domain-containing protein [Streptococcus uberis]MTB61180.1 methyltransferase domain-containing protein [Streptococcus uberis]MTB78715.1 methyltransferase domain-containing protein [Streptococcus uberis]
MKKPIQMSHDFLEEWVTKDSIFVDATVGNGNDTLYFAPLVKKVYAFDIQKEAISRTQQKLEANGIENVILIHDGHENVNHYVQDIDAAIFNLGYLPHSDKKIVTKSSTTLQAIKKIYERLVKGGRIALMVYYGHDGGEEEKDAILQYLSTMDQKQTTVMVYQSLNQVNCPPYLVMIEKLAN